MKHDERVGLTCRHELEVRLVVDLANVVGMYHNKHRLPDVIEDEDFFVEIGDNSGHLHESVIPLSDVISRLAAEGWDELAVIEHLSDTASCEPLLGIYLQVAVPVMKDRSYSWGHCRLQWIFGSTYEEAFKAACEWAKEQGHDCD